MIRAALLALVAACTTSDRATPDAAIDAPPVPVACDGALCDTTNHASCSAASPQTLAWFALPLALVVRRRRSR